jgi:hypothetical protein
LTKVLHGSHGRHAPSRANRHLRTTANISSVSDKGAAAVVDVEAETVLADSGEAAPHESVEPLRAGPGTMCHMTEAVIILDFDVRGGLGRVTVTVSRNDAPELNGCEPAAHGFPVCEATVDTPLRGYNALLGWVQVVGFCGAPGSERRFVTDPLQIFDHLDLPFGFYGINPTLFDAPSRRDRSQYVDWLSHSFLCVSPGGPMQRVVQPVAAFQWGFVVNAGTVQLVPPVPLPLTEWATHRPLLTTRYPSWEF